MEQSQPESARNSLDPLYRSLVEEALEFALFMVDLDGTIRSWNRGVLEIFGYARDEFVGRADTLVFGVDGVRRFLDTPGGWAGTRLSHKDGSGVHAQILVARVTGSAAEHAGYRVMVRRTPEREQDSTLELILDQLPFGLVVAAAGSGELLAFNREAERVLGHPMRPVHNYREYTKYGKLHADGRPYTAEEYPLAQAVLGNSIENEGVLYRRGDGTLTHLSVSAVPVLDAGGNIVAAVSSFYDVSERIRAEAERDQFLKELQRSNDDLSQFAHTVSHDLQAPLRTLRSYTELLVRRYGPKLEGPGVEFVRFIADGAARMDDLVHALLRYARAGGAELNPIEVDTAEVVSSVLTHFAPVIAESGAIVGYENMPRLIADPVQLTQLFQNLLSNALTYGRKGVAPEITVSAVRQGAQWLFTVADNGSGIAPAHQDRIFLPLKRLHGPDVPGSGMGLAICRRIVQRHGGHIWVESEAGRGAAFHFTLPALPE